MSALIERTVDRGALVKPESLSGYTFTSEAMGHTFIITTTLRGEEQPISGTITGSFLRADNEVVDLNGTVIDGKAQVSLSYECYDVPGRFLLTIYRSDTGESEAIYSAVGTVLRADSDTHVDTGIIPTFASLTAAQEAANEAAALANAAAVAGDNKYVRYDAAQTMTDAQKAQARANIGASSAEEASELKSVIFAYTSMTPKTTWSGWYIKDNGTRTTATGKSVYGYQVTAGKYYYFNTDQNWVFQDDSGVPTTGTNNKIVGSLKTGNNCVVSAPTNATYLYVTADTSAEFACYSADPYADAALVAKVDDLDTGVQNLDTALDSFEEAITNKKTYTNIFTPDFCTKTKDSNNIALSNKITLDGTKKYLFYLSFSLGSYSAAFTMKVRLLYSVSVSIGNIDITGNGTYEIYGTVTGQSGAVVATLVSDASGYTVTAEKLYLFDIGNDNDVEIIKTIRKTNYIDPLPIYTITAPATDDKEIGVICWGDSLTAGTGSSTSKPDTDTNTDTSYPAVLGRMIANDVINGGAGGEPSWMIAARAGGESIYVEPCTIPATTTAVRVYLHGQEQDYFYQSGEWSYLADNLSYNIAVGDKSQVNPCVIGGIEGTLSKELISQGDPDPETGETVQDSTYAYYFTRSVAGSAVVLPVRTQIITNGYLTRRSRVAVIWAGQNDAPSHDGSYITQGDATARIKSIVDVLTSDKYIVMDLPSGSNSNSAKRVQGFISEFGNHYLNIREYICINGIDYVNNVLNAGITLSSADQELINAGTIPGCLKSDSVHGNYWYYQIVAKAVYDKGVALGYWV